MSFYSKGNQGQTYVHFTVDSIAAIDSTSRSAAIVPPACTSLSVGTVTSHVSRVATNTTDDAGRVVLTLRAIVLAVTNLSAVLASLVLVVSQGTVESSQFSKLISLQFVLTFRNGSSLHKEN